jgi:hypothetical protein
MDTMLVVGTDAHATDGPRTCCADPLRALVARAESMLERTRAAQQLVSTRSAAAGYLALLDATQLCPADPAWPHVAELRRWVEVSEALVEQMQSI